MKISLRLFAVIIKGSSKTLRKKVLNGGGVHKNDLYENFLTFFQYDLIFYEENFVQTNIFFFPVIVCPYLLEKKNLG